MNIEYETQWSTNGGKLQCHVQNQNIYTLLIIFIFSTAKNKANFTDFNSSMCVSSTQSPVFGIPASSLLLLLQLLQYRQFFCTQIETIVWSGVLHVNEKVVLAGLHSTFKDKADFNAH